MKTQMIDRTPNMTEAHAHRATQRASTVDAATGRSASSRLAITSIERCSAALSAVANLAAFNSFAVEIRTFWRAAMNPASAQLAVISDTQKNTPKNIHGAYVHHLGTQRRRRRFR